MQHLQTMGKVTHRREREPELLFTVHTYFFLYCSKYTPTFTFIWVVCISLIKLFKAKFFVVVVYV